MLVELKVKHLGDSLDESRGGADALASDYPYPCVSIYALRVLTPFLFTADSITASIGLPRIGESR